LLRIKPRGDLIALASGIPIAAFCGQAEPLVGLGKVALDTEAASVKDRKIVFAIDEAVDGGAAEGAPSDLPPAPKFSEGWAIGAPDLILRMKEEYTVQASGPDEYQYFTISTGFTEDKYVQFAEIKRGDPAVVHHVIVSVREPGQGPMPAPGEINLGAAANRDGEARTAQQPGQGGGRGNTQDGMLVGWAPGMSPLSLRDGQAKLIKKGSMLIFQMH